MDTGTRDNENNAALLKPESYVFIRGLIDCFYRNEELQFNVDQSLPWLAFTTDMIMCAESGKLGKKVIRTRDGEEDYLIRHYLINERPKTRVTLHKTLISDTDELHNHPWAWASLILTGGYWEDTPEGKFWRPPGHFRVRKASDLHRLIVDPKAGTVWTLFIMGEKEQDWGFLQPDGSIEQWQKYLHRKTGIWYNE